MTSLLLVVLIVGAGCPGGSAEPSQPAPGRDQPRIGSDPEGVIESVAWIPWDEAAGDEVPPAPWRSPRPFAHVFASTSDRRILLGVYNVWCRPAVTVGVDSHTGDGTRLRLTFEDCEAPALSDGEPPGFGLEVRTSVAVDPDRVVVVVGTE